MAYTVEFLKEKNYFIIDFAGESGVPEIRMAFEELMAHPDFFRNADVLWDMSKSVNHIPSIAEIRAFQHWNKAVLDKRGDSYRSALVLKKPHEYGMGRIYQAYVDSLPHEFQVFRDRESAEEWLTSER